MSGGQRKFSKLLAASLQVRKNLEPENQTCRRLGCVSPCVSVEPGQAEIGGFVHESSVLASQRDMSQEWIVSTDAIQKCTPGLGVGSEHRSEGIPSRTKYQPTTAAQYVWAEFKEVNREVENQIGSGRMHIGLHSG